jgi:aldose 1-epimerase
MSEIVTLRAGSMRMDLAPAACGAVTRLSSGDGDSLIHWLRPATPNAVPDRASGGMACFPLVPFSNRIRNGRFTFAGRTVQLPANFPPEPHAVHGDGWQVSWSLVERTQSSATIEYLHASGAWPYAYRARQNFELEPGCARLRVSVINEASEPMPAGFGFHPFFVRTPRARVTASVAGMWQTDADSMPTTLVPLPAQLPLAAAGIVPGEVSLDTHFTGFGGSARIEWPEWRARLRLDTSGPFGCLVVFTPPGKDFFCVEPVTNIIDAFNLAAAGRTDTGMMVLAPGAIAEGTMTLTPELP